MILQFNKKHVLITGAGSGIGEAMALYFGRMGAVVYLIDNNESLTKKVAAEIRQQGGRAEVLICDVSNAHEVQTIIKSCPIIDVLINNAGVAHIGNAENTTMLDFDRIININIKGVFNFIQAVIPVMKTNGGGVILNMSSIAAHVGLRDRFAYSMSKGAVHAMSLSVAKDYLKDGIRCNTISPARVHTPFVDNFIHKNYPENEAEIFRQLSLSQPIGRMAQPKEIAMLAAYLCSDDAGFITGCDYPIDGGFIKLSN